MREKEQQIAALNEDMRLLSGHNASLKARLDSATQTQTKLQLSVSQVRGGLG